MSTKALESVRSALSAQGRVLGRQINCKPIRFSAEKAEALVWAKIEELLGKPEFARNLVERARKEFSGSKYVDEVKRLKSRITGYAGQIDALTERLSQLPKTVSAAPFFNQMEKLEKLKRQDEALLGQAKAKQQRDEPIAFLDYQDFLASLKSLRGTLGSEAKAKIIEKLVHKVELLPDRLLIHFYVGQSLLQGELLSKEGSSPFFYCLRSEMARTRSENRLISFGLSSESLSRSLVRIRLTMATTARIELATPSLGN